MKFEKEANILKALGHPIRLRMVFHFAQDNKCNVNTMVEKLNIPQSSVSQQLAVLRNCGIIVPQKEGVKTCYNIADNRVKDLLKIFYQQSEHLTDKE